MHPARINVAEVHEKVAQLSRSPFREQAARILACAPTNEAIVNLAERNPDRWGQLLAIVARLAGYTDKLEVEATVHAKVSAMSDSELQAALDAMKNG